MLRRTANVITASSRRLLSSSSSTSQAADVCVVGAGIMGLNVALQLKRRMGQGSRVIVLEAAPGLGVGSSGYSTGFVRAFYSLDETMRLALDGIAAYKNWTSYLRTTEAKASFHRTDALWMLGADASFNAGMQQRLAKFGVESDVVDAEQIAERLPLLSLDPFPLLDDECNEIPQELPPLSAVYEYGCGYLDPSACLSDLRDACEREGVEVRFNAPAERFLVEGGRVVGVGGGGKGGGVSAGVVVNAAGPWFEKLNRGVGVEYSTTSTPIRIQVAHKCLPAGEFLDLPFTCDLWGASGIYFVPRRESKQLVFGSIDHKYETEEVDPDKLNASLDPDVKQTFLSALFHRLPGLPQSGQVTGFSSMYTVNQDDLHPVVGETSVKGLWACNGFSGHGFKLAPAIGSMVAQQVTGVKCSGELGETEVPLGFLAADRKPLKELGESGGSVLA